jgi:Flp pilus assembly pilin Flp
MKQLLLLGCIITTTFSFSQTQIAFDINGEAFLDQSGRSISISKDGNIIAIGAPGNDGEGSNSGHVRVYMNTNGSWEQIGQDIDGEASGDQSGGAVSLSSDGSIVAIGATDNDGNGSDSGHVRVYKNTNGDWVQIGQDINGEASDYKSGRALSLSSDGTIIAIGTLGIGGNGPFDNSGYVRIYKDINGNWEQIGQDINGRESGDAAGKSVSISSDGNIVAIGATDNNNGGNGYHSGYVRIYQNINGSWEQIGQDINGEAEFDSSGFSLRLSSDGGIVAIGAVGNSGNGSVSGHVRIYQNTNGIWEQIGQDIDGESSGDGSGYSLSLSSDGSVVVIGAISNAENGLDSGQVRVYQNINGNWEQVGQDLNGAEDERLGRSVSLSGDGSTIAIGAHSASTVNGTYSGYVKVYDFSAVLSSNSFSLSQFNIYPNPTKDQFTIQLQEGVQLKKVCIYNQLGQFITSSTVNSMNTQSLSKGIYFVQIETTNGKATKKLIVE